MKWRRPSRSALEEALKKGRVGRHPLMALRHLPIGGATEIAVVTGKRVSPKATVRNLLKRRTLAVARHALPPEGIRAVFLLTPEARKASYQDLLKAAQELIRRALPE